MLKLDSQGLVPAIIQDAETNDWNTPVSWMNDFGNAQDDWYRLDHEAGK